jgi:hypothetical protein
LVFCAEKFERGGGAVSVVLRVFLRGVLEKTGGWTWFFDGENVVECVVNVVRWRSLFRFEKRDTDFGFIFVARWVLGLGVPVANFLLESFTLAFES